MKRALFLGLAFFGGQALAAPIISPSTATVYLGNTVQITSTDTITCAMASGSTGTVTSGCLYTAPISTMAAKNIVAGCPALPNDHIFNTRIDNLPVDANSQTRINNILGGTSGYIQFEVEMPLNVMSANTPTTAMTFLYTPNNDATFPTLPFPYMGVQGSALPDNYTARDRHVLGVSTTTCQYYEMYNYYPAGTVTSLGCPTCNSSSGIQYSGMSYQLPDTTGGSGGATDAAGMYLLPLLLRYSDLVGPGEINHALRFTLANGYVYSGFLWPGVASTVQCGNFTTCVPYGSRFRLKSSFNISSYSATTQKILRALQRYGMFFVDGGTSMRIAAANDVFNSTITFAAIQNEIRTGSIASQFSFEQVDESSLMVSSSTGKVNLSNAYVVPDNYAEVIATKVSDSSTATLRIAIQPVTVGTYNIPYPINVGALSVMAGTPQFQIPYHVKGSTTTTVTCSMSPTVGTLTSGCLYTPPTTQLNVISTAAVRITPTADPVQASTFTLVIFPSDGIRIDVGGKSVAGAPAPPYVGTNYGPDVLGNMWWTDPVGSGPGWGTKQDGYYSQTLWIGSTTVSDIGRYYTYWPGISDGAYAMLVPNGNYTLTLGFGVGDPGAMGISEVLQSVDTQGVTVISTTTMKSITGITNYTPTTTSVSVSVTNNQFYFALRDVNVSGRTLIDFWSLLPAAATPGSTSTSQSIKGGCSAFGGVQFK